MGRLFSRNQRESMVSDDGTGSNSREWLKFFKIFLFRVPLWVFVVGFLVIGSVNLYQSWTTDSPTNLKPAITDSPATHIRITMCNERVDDIGLNVRNEELRLEKRFEDVENVEKARVRISRQDCDENKETDAEQK